MTGYCIVSEGDAVYSRGWCSWECGGNLHCAKILLSPPQIICHSSNAYKLRDAINFTDFCQNYALLTKSTLIKFLMFFMIKMIQLLIRMSLYNNIVSLK